MVDKVVGVTALSVPFLSDHPALVTADPALAGHPVTTGWWRPWRASRSRCVRGWRRRTRSWRICGVSWAGPADRGVASWAASRAMRDDPAAGGGGACRPYQPLAGAVPGARSAGTAALGSDGALGACRALLRLSHPHAGGLPRGPSS